MNNFQQKKYFSIIIETEWDKYETVPDDEKEIYLRNIISRLYYTCFHIIKERKGLPDWDSNDRSHEVVKKAINNKGLRKKLKALYDFRVKADYKYQEFKLPLHDKRNLSIVNKKNIDNIIKTFETVDL